MLVTANSRISLLESHIQLVLHPKYKEMHVQLTRSVGSGWDFIHAQDQCIATLRDRVDVLSREMQIEKNLCARKDLEISNLKGEAEAERKLAGKDRELVEFFQKEAKIAKKSNKLVSADGQIRIYDATKNNMVLVVTR